MGSERLTSGELDKQYKEEQFLFLHGKNISDFLSTQKNKHTVLSAENQEEAQAKLIESYNTIIVDADQEEVKNLEDFLNELVEETPLSRESFNIGCKFENYDFKEHLERGLYIPTAGYCVEKTIEKFANKMKVKYYCDRYKSRFITDADKINLKLIEENKDVVTYSEEWVLYHQNRNVPGYKPNIIGDKIIFNMCCKNRLCRTKHEYYKKSAYGYKLSDIRNRMKKIFGSGANYEIIRQDVKEYACKNNNGWMLVGERRNRIQSNLCIGLIKLKKSNWHAILVDPFKFSYKQVLEKAELHNEKLGFKEKQIRFRQRRNTDNKTNNIFVYDIETYSRYNSELEEKELIPYSIAVVQIVGTPDKDDLYLQYKIDNDSFRMFNGEDCIQQFMKFISENHTGRSQYFAHNGSRFDAVLILTEIPKNFEVVQLLGGNSNIKQLTLKAGDNLYKFKDSYQFTPMMSLDKLSGPKCLKVKHPKFKFDIVDKPLEWYQKYEYITEKDEMEEHTEEEKQYAWRTYLKRDVIALAECLIKLEEIFNNEFDESITTSVGVPGIAIKYFEKQYDDILFIPKDYSVRKFIRESVYGGRMIHWKLSGKNLISLDCNSLYPTGQAKGEFPIGRSYLIEDNKQFNELVKERNKLFIAEVTLDGKNRRFPIVPYRTEQIPGEYRRLLYPSNEFTGVYTCIDIFEAIDAGYELKEFHQGIMWKEKMPLFKRMENVYERRLELKKVKNPIEYVYKIILNSAYGKYVENPACSYLKGKKYEERKHEKEIAKLELSNDEILYKLSAPEDAEGVPAYIGAFILSYSRRIMNNYIKDVGYEYIYYGDTDSIYIDKFRFDELLEQEKALPIEERKYNVLGMGKMKNDYGEGVVIEEATFIDNKRYLLKFNDDSFKAHYVGLKADEQLHLSSIDLKSKEELYDNTKTKEENEENYKILKEENKEINKENLEKLKDKVFNKLENNEEVKHDQVRWIKGIGGITINTKEFIFHNTKHTKGNWINKEFYPLDYNYEINCLNQGQCIPKKKNWNISNVTDSQNKLNFMKQHNINFNEPITEMFKHMKKPIPANKTISLNIEQEISPFKENNGIVFKENTVILGKKKTIKNIVFTQNGESFEFSKKTDFKTKKNVLTIKTDSNLSEPNAFKILSSILLQHNDKICKLGNETNIKKLLKA